MKRRHPILPHRWLTLVAMGCVASCGGEDPPVGAVQTRYDWSAVPAVRAAVCTRAEDNDGHKVGPSLAWFTRELTFALHADGTADIAADDEFGVVEAAFRVWQGVQACAPPHELTDLTFTRLPNVTGTDFVIGFNRLEPENNQNLVVFRDHDYPSSHLELAAPTVSYVRTTGEIIDADIEINTEDNAFTIGDGFVRSDLLNTAVHEVGHFVGLGHPNAYAEIDPDCRSHATMCLSALEGETEKRDLTCDDRDLLVFRYPAGRPRGYCVQPDCARGLEGCGNCAPWECEPWRACGFCGEPESILDDVEVTEVDPDEGCAAAPGHPMPLALLLGWLVARRRSG